MPARIQPNRPYYPRLYLPHPRQPNVAPASARAGRGGAGGAAGGLFTPPDVTPTGNPATDIGKAINAIAQNYQQNKLANRLMNTENPPRAAWVGGVTPAVGVPTTGTAPIKGGVQEMQFQQQLAADAAAKQQQDLADQLQKAKIASQLALAQQRTGRGRGVQTGTGNAQRWQQYLGRDGQTDGNIARGRGRGGKPPAYEPGSIDPLTDPKADKFQIVQADFDAQYGKGMYSKVAPYLANATVDDKGNYVITNPKGDVVMTLPPARAQYWLSRYNAASVRAGQEPIFTDKFPTANPNSGKAPGSPENPFKPSNQLDARGLPYNSYFVDPSSGQIGQKLPEDKQPATGQETSQVDTDRDTAALAEEEAVDRNTGNGGEQQPLDLASLMPSNAPRSFDLGNAPTGGLPQDQDTSLADAISKARVQSQLQGVA